MDDPTLLAHKLLPEGRVARLHAQLYNWHITVSENADVGFYIDDW